MGVTIAPVTGPATFACSGTPDYHFTPCGAARWRSQRLETLELGAGPAFEGAYDGLGLAITVWSETSPARACLRYYTDEGGSTRVLECADSGSLTLSVWPASQADADAMHATMHLHFPDGATVDATF